MKDSYSQFRSVGQGTHDESIQTGFTDVTLNVNIKSVPFNENSTAQPYDLFIVTEQSDYECYIRAVTLLDQKIGLDCSFLNDNDKSYLNQQSTSISQKRFLSSSKNYEEYFFIIDNTDFPMFSFDANEDTKTRQDVMVEVEYTTEYLAQQEYFTLAYYAGGGTIFFLFFLIITVFCYKRHKRIFMHLAEQRRKIKEEMMKKKGNSRSRKVSNVEELDSENTTETQPKEVIDMGNAKNFSINDDRYDEEEKMIPRGEDRQAVERPTSKGVVFDYDD